MMALQRKTLFVSAGHSAKDPGAVGVEGLSEADIVLDFRDRLYSYLSTKVKVGRDGEMGENMPLSSACKMAQSYDVAVEFHCNSFSSPSATGVETLSAPKDDQFGERICAAIAGTLGIANRGDKGEGSGQHSRLAFVQAGGVIIELFFLSNPNDLKAYRDNLDALVRAVGDVLVAEVCSDYEGGGRD